MENRWINVSSWYATTTKSMPNWFRFVSFLSDNVVCVKKWWNVCFGNDKIDWPWSMNRNCQLDLIGEKISVWARNHRNGSGREGFICLKSNNNQNSSNPLRKSLCQGNWWWKWISESKTLHYCHANIHLYVWFESIWRWWWWWWRWTERKNGKLNNNNDGINHKIIRMVLCKLFHLNCS